MLRTVQELNYLRRKELNNNNKKNKKIFAIFHTALFAPHTVVGFISFF